MVCVGLGCGVVSVCASAANKVHAAIAVINSFFILAVFRNAKVGEEVGSTRLGNAKAFAISKDFNYEGRVF